MHVIIYVPQMFLTLDPYYISKEYQIMYTTIEQF